MLRWLFGNANWSAQVEINNDQIAYNRSTSECIKNLIETNEALSRRIAALESLQRRSP